MYWVVANRAAAKQRLGEQRRKNEVQAEIRGKLSEWIGRCMGSIDRSRWVPKGAVDSLLAANPPPTTKGFTWKDLAGDERPADSLLRSMAEHNAAHLAHQRSAMRGFFDTVETNPLTEEQIQACICMDDNVLIVAAAGS